jgi:hypothetical protein
MGLNPFNPQWPKETADTIERLVQRVRDTFTTKVVVATNALVYGVAAAFVGLLIAVIAVKLLTRTVQVYLVWDLGDPGTWVVGILALVGLALIAIGIATANPGLIGFGAAVAVITGGKWALTMGDVHIDHDTSVWISYYVVGGILVLGGAFLMSKRTAPELS